MSGVTGIGQSRMSELINTFGGSDTTLKDEAPKKGSNMSETAKSRLGELQSTSPGKMSKAEKRELSGLQQQYDKPELMKLAKTAQETGGVMAGHSVALTQIANEKDVCICIRAVNPLATGLVESGFGTKDMSIKAKSSNLPPLNGLIPFDQSYGKKGFDPAQIEKFTHKNEEAIEKKVATSANATMPRDRLDYLMKETGRMTMTEEAKGLKEGEVLLTSNDFKSDKLPKGLDFNFIAVPTGDKDVTIYGAKWDDNDGWVRDEKPVQVMANRDGKPVTADYDLALVAPRVKDLGPEHMSSLKMASFEEVSRRTLAVNRMDDKVGDGVRQAVDTYLRAGTETEKTQALEAFKEFAPNGLTESEVKAMDTREVSPEGLAKGFITRLARDEFLSTAVPEALAQNSERYAPSQEGMETARNAILEALAPPAGEPMSFSEFNETFFNITGVDLKADTKYERIVDNFPNLNFDELSLLANDLGAALENTPSRDTGIISPFVRELVPELNQTVGQTDGREVFHHGEDSGNPYSVEKDNFPMTVILPEGATRGGDPIRVINDSKEFLELAKDLKRQGYAVPVNEMWNSETDLMSVRTESFTEARDKIANQLGASVQDMVRMSDINRGI